MNAARMRWRRRSMSAARMMTTMTRPMRNMALASLDDLLGAGRRAAADPWGLLSTLHRKPLTGNFILESAVSFRLAEDRLPGGATGTNDVPPIRTDAAHPLHQIRAGALPAT